MHLFATTPVISTFRSYGAPPKTLKLKQRLNREEAPAGISNALMQHALYNISGFHSSSTPGVFCTYFYNHAHRLRLEKLL
jgi:hypothetical protein